MTSAPLSHGSRQPPRAALDTPCTHCMGIALGLDGLLRDVLSSPCGRVDSPRQPCATYAAPASAHGERAIHACARHMRHSTPHAAESMCDALAAPLLPAGSLYRAAR
ncbi:hypothetical protein F511_33606 [Dorcoceras hygrometricum]|uniref:Uncharacterized protein n=1 Tax=Dorcoceras hygrometricum TaxID=472368 RepID=A0A2Z7B2S9_9LAMI|nr:hypothetical protein F511_33606 [Dorcoceras hygrometricum]